MSNLFRSVVLAVVVGSIAGCGAADTGAGAGAGGGSATGTGGGSAAGGAGGGSVAGTGGGSAVGGGSGGGSVTGAGGGSVGGTGGGSGAISFATTVFPILQAKCTAACHGGLYQTRVNAYARLMGTTLAGAECASMPRVVVGNGAASLVVRKMIGTANCGTKMPNITPGVACTGDACVATADIATIALWIDQGAQNTP